MVLYPSDRITDGVRVAEREKNCRHGDNIPKVAECVCLVPATVLLESAAQVWRGTRLNTDVGARAQSVYGGGVSLWDN
jgi:hypothetical protein